MQEINAWLNSDRPFEAGVELYTMYGSNSFFQKLLLSDGPTQFNIDKLEAELESLAPATPANTDAPPISITDDHQLPKTTEAGTDQPQVDAKQHARYLSLKELQRNKYRQLDHNIAALGMSNDQTFLHLTAKQILTLHAHIQDIFKLIDHYDEHGSFPVLVIKEEVIRTPAEEIQLLWQSNSRAKARLKSGKCRNIEQTEQLIIKNNARIAAMKGEADL